MQPPANRPAANLGLRLFRILRIAGLIVALVIVCVGLYVNRVGLPKYFTQRLLKQVRAHGWAPEADRIRLSFQGGLSVENMRINRVNGRPGVNFSAGTVELYPVWSLFTHPRFALRKIVVHNGNLTCAVQPTNQPTKTVALRDIEIQAEFKGLRRLTVRRCEANLAGVKLRLSGTFTNTSALLKLGKPPIEKAPDQLELNLWKLATLLEQIRFIGVPVVHVDICGDAAVPESLTGLVAMTIEGAETPWCTLSNATATLRVNSIVCPGAEPVAKLQVQVGHAKSMWGTVANTVLQINWSVNETEPELLHAIVELTTRPICTDQVQVDQLSLAAQCEHFLTNPIPICVTSTVHMAGLKTRLGNADKLNATVELYKPFTNKPVNPTADFVWATRCAPVNIKSRLDLGGVTSTNFPLETFACELCWSMPTIVLSNVIARFNTGELRGWLGVDFLTRQVEFGFNSNFDIRQLMPLLSENAQRWLARFEWKTAPKIVGYGTLALPPWTNKHPNLPAVVQPTLQLWGELDTGELSYRGIEACSVHANFLYSNMCWYLPALRIKRPEGDVKASIVSSDRTRQIYCIVEGDVDPGALRPVLDEGTKQRLDLLKVTQPAHVKLQIWGAHAEKLPRGLLGCVSLTNFTFRGEPIASFWTELDYTNHMLTLSNPVALRDQQFVNAERVEIDFGVKTVRIKNASGCAAPMTVARAIGPKPAQAIAPYQFLHPPHVRVNGTVPFEGTTGTDLTFEIDAGPFRWWRFSVAQIRGRVHWIDTHVQLTITESDFYKGKLAGTALFDFSHPSYAQFKLDTTFTNVELQSLLSAISPYTNRLEGLLTGQLQVHQANTLDWVSCAGNAQVQLRDGYVWQFPLFSVFSPILDAIIPGLGNSRFTDGSAHFTITNGTVRSSDLELRAPFLRMKLRGTVDFNENVDARIEAELLRDTWLIGPLISTALQPLTKIFEYKLSGTLTAPKAEPIHVPKILFAPLQPVRMFKSLFTGEQKNNNSKPKP